MRNVLSTIGASVFTALALFASPTSATEIVTLSGNDPEFVVVWNDPEALHLGKLALLDANRWKVVGNDEMYRTLLEAAAPLASCIVERDAIARIVSRDVMTATVHVNTEKCNGVVSATEIN